MDAMRDEPTLHSYGVAGGGGPNRIKPFRVDCAMVFISNKNFDVPGDFSPAI
jgi:hypothetical protein